MTQNIPQACELFQHFKGGLYTVVGVGKHSETQEDMVAYVDENGDLWFRPLSMWNDLVEKDGERVPRFKSLGMLHGIIAALSDASESGS
ncbi:DUF1653 domain-containing protein [Alicyclobacillus shizuokensis]|uniref:DUF1653 domain-containing protein n=1 Tax=Alicyclobacillus shizuokensis TaxID=392014 RepID=UPI000830CEE7|nr:DUF1653 domain-containing protein [Alicyclobacillus shizuokensis]